MTLRVLLMAASLIPSISSAYSPTSQIQATIPMLSVFSASQCPTRSRTSPLVRTLHQHLPGMSLSSLTYPTSTRSQQQTLTSFSMQLPVLLRGNQRHRSNPDPDLECLQLSRADLNVRCLIHWLVAMGRGHSPRSRPAAAIYQGEQERNCGPDPILCSEQACN